MRLLYTGFVPLNQNENQPELVIRCLQYTKEAGTPNNQSTGRKIFLLLDSTTSSGFSVSNRKLLSKTIHWWLNRNTVSSNFVVAGIGQKTK